MRLNFDKLQYKKTEVDFFGETYTTSGHKPAQSKVSAVTGMPVSNLYKASAVIHWNGQLFIKFLSKSVRACRTD